MMDFTKVVGAVDSQPPLTLETMMAAIEALKRPGLPEDHPLHGVYESFECAALKGLGLIVVSEEKAYYNPDIFELKEVKVLKLPDPPKPELNFKWDFETTINWDYRL